MYLRFKLIYKFKFEKKKSMTFAFQPKTEALNWDMMAAADLD